jgi:7,8-dihydro-6-hydroxymethylpterin-pyrophosphokinase
LNAIDFVEQQLKRKRDAENINAARTIDIDIALFNQDILRIEHRKIPDPEIFERAFLAIPLAEIDPGYLHPETNQTLNEIAEGFRSSANVMQRRLDVRLRNEES